MLTLGAGLLIAPGTFDGLWSWPLTPLTGRAIGAFVFSTGLAAALGVREDDWTRIRAINLDGVYRGCRLFGRQMVDRGQGGHLVNLSSMAAYAPSSTLPAYAATKAAVLQLSECLRLELAEHGIGVSAICPGVVNTPIVEHAQYVGVPAEEADRMRARARRMFARRDFPPEKVALAIMRAVLNDRPVVPVAAEAYAGRAMSRISPAANRALSVLSRRLDPSVRAATRAGRRAADARRQS